MVVRIIICYSAAQKTMTSLMVGKHNLHKLTKKIWRGYFRYAIWFNQKFFLHCNLFGVTIGFRTNGYIENTCIKIEQFVHRK
jgi:hypothetical protein